MSGHGQGDSGTRFRHGPSSFSMNDPETVFRALDLKPEETFLDLGCGPGDYSLHAARIVRAPGFVLSFDIWDIVVGGLRQEIEAFRIPRIHALVADMTKPLPLKDATVDICFMATVLHALNLERDGKVLFSEIQRIVSPRGRVAVLECKKEAQPWGPPVHVRLSPDQVVDAMAPFGFLKSDLVDLGRNYLLLLEDRSLDDPFRSRP